MSDDFDLELRDRLVALSVAVPVAGDELVHSVSPRFRAGAASRRLSFGPLIPLVAVLVIGAVVAGIAGLRPFGPNGGGNGPVVATVTDGAFELTIRSAKARYVESEPIQIEAALTYRGPSATIEILHAQGAHGGPLGFGIEEPVIGDLRLATGWDLSCERSTLAAGTPLAIQFQKGGAWSSVDPRADAYRAYVEDPVLRLKAGTWHVYVVAEFSLGDCGGEAHRLRADIAIDVVVAEPSNAPSEPAAHGPVIATASDGQFELVLRSTKLRYAPDEPIEIEASLAYEGDATSIQIFHGLGADDGPLAFGVAEPIPLPGGGTIELSPVVRDACRSSLLDRGVALQVPFVKSGGQVVETSPTLSPEAVQAYFADPVLRLPPGSWHPLVGAGFSLGSCGGEMHGLRAELAIVVSDDPRATPSPAIAPLPTAADEGTLPIGDDQQVGPWQLVLRSPHRQYSAGEPIDAVAELGYWGEAASVDTFGSSGGRIGFGIRQVDGALEMEPDFTAECARQGPVPTGERQIIIPFAKSGGYSADDPNADFWESYLREPELRLPTGTWEIVAVTAFALSADCQVPGPELRASITITVVP